MITIGSWILMIVSLYGTYNPPIVVRLDTQKQCESIGTYIIHDTSNMDTYKCFQIDENGIVTKP